MRTARAIRCTTAVAVAVVTLAPLPRAAAQHCHAPPSVPAERIGLRIGLQLDAASYRTDPARYAGDYQGLLLGAEWTHRWIRLRVVLPAYRLVRNGAESYGLGDVLVAARVPFGRSEDGSLEGGVEVAASFPSGAAAADLGMGHVMLMPGLWVAWAGPRLFAQAQLNFGRALAAGDGGHHRGGPGPIVNPMNLQEVSAAGTAGIWLERRFRIRATLYGAVPIATEAGAVRAVVGVGVDLVLPVLDLGVEGQLPIAGSPFTGKLATTVGVRF